MKILPGDFIDIGNGWFFTLDKDFATPADTCPQGAINDSRSPNPDVFYGPTEWKGKDGPTSAATLLQIEGIRAASGDDALYPFPGTVSVYEAGLDADLGAVNGHTFDSLEALLQHPAFKRKDDVVGAIGSTAVRLDATKLDEPMLDEAAVLWAAFNEFHLAQPMEGQAEEAGRRAAIRGIMVRLGIYEKFVRIANGSPTTGTQAASSKQPHEGRWFPHDGMKDPDTAGDTLVQVCFRDGYTAFGFVHDWDQNWHWAGSEAGMKSQGAIIAWRPHRP
jgi:hypothetical protein